MDRVRRRRGGGAPRVPPRAGVLQGAATAGGAGLTRMAASLKQWPVLILAVPLDLVFLPVQAIKDICCHTCTDTEAARPKGTAL